MAESEYMGFSAAQAAYVKNSGHCWCNVCEGGKRAGKNVCNILAFAMNVDRHPDRLHLAAGVSIAAARMNILDSNGFGLLRFFGGRCRVGAYMGKQALTVRGAGGAEKVIVFAGGGKSNDAALIKGNSYGSAYVSEVNECHDSFFREVMDRTLASSDRRLFFDLNPKPPGHWFYREFLDMQDSRLAAGRNPGYQYARFTMADNMSVSDEQLRAVLATYDAGSPWFQSEILGRRVTAAGRIYEDFGPSAVVGRAEIDGQRFAAFAVGVDVGGTDATAATLAGFTEGFGAVWLLDGYYHKQGKASGYTHDRYAAEITDSIGRWGQVYRLDGAYVFCESADKLFRQALANQLRKEGLNLRVTPAYKQEGILDRIRLTAMLLHQDRYKVAGHMRPWLDAYENARWVEEDRAEGRWRRLDNGSYPVDALDSAEYAVQPYKSRLLL